MLQQGPTQPRSQQARTPLELDVLLERHLTLEAQAASPEPPAHQYDQV